MIEAHGEMQEGERDTGQRSLEPASDGEHLEVDQQLQTKEMCLLAYISMLLPPQVYQKENKKQAQLQIDWGTKESPP